MELLQFIFQDFVHFIGTIILIYALAEGIGLIVGTFKPSSDDKKDKDGDK